MIRAYFISGLGADQHAFSKLELPDTIEITHLPWIKPTGPNESIVSYAKRMAKDIIPGDRTVIVGLSFGGVIAIEIAKQIEVHRIILLNSIKSEDELPPWLQLIAKTEVYKLIPAQRLLDQREIAFRFFGISSKPQKEFLTYLFDHADPEIVKWSIKAILSWKNNKIPANLIHIHGTSDAVFPQAFVEADHWVKGGPHFMVFTHAKAVSKLLETSILFSA